MRRINEYKKLFSIEGPIDLKILKTTYRNLVKEWHPDKFLEEDKKLEAEVVSKKIIDGYHFLVSIAPETKEANRPAYEITTSQSGMVDYKHKGLILEISFADGTTYEYFGVDENMFRKLINSDKPYRFAKRSIFNSYLYRKSKKDAVLE
jgi:dimeric dUTPase (all-alpha-NTP-PPase superfamily)